MAHAFIRDESSHLQKLPAKPAKKSFSQKASRAKIQEEILQSYGLKASDQGNANSRENPIRLSKMVQVEDREPTPDEIQKEVARQKAIGAMTELSHPVPFLSATPYHYSAERHLVEQMTAQAEISAHQKFFSDTQVISIQKPIEYQPQITFNPLLPIPVPVPTQADVWNSVKSEHQPFKTQVTFRVSTARQLIKPADSEVKWLRMLGCSIGATVCMGTLITYGTISGGSTPEALFWSTVTTVASSILLVLPFRWESWKGPKSYQSIFVKLFGVFLVVVSYTTLHTANETAEQEIVTIASSGTTKEQLIQKNIDDLEAQLKPIHQAIEALDPVTDQKAIARLQKRAQPKEELLFTARNDLIAAQAPSEVSKKVSASTAGNWSHLQWLRQLILEPLNLLCLHSLMKGMPELRGFIRRKKAARAQRRLEANTKFKLMTVKGV